MERRKAAQLRALAGMSMNLAVAVLTVGLFAPLLELFAQEPNDGAFGIWQSAVGGTIGVVLVVLGLYLISRADE